MPHLSGSASSNLTKAFSPPAEATMPTIGRTSGPRSFGGGGGAWIFGFAAGGAPRAAGFPPAFAAPLVFVDLRDICAMPNDGNQCRCYANTVSLARLQACFNSNRSRLLPRLQERPGTIAAADRR